MTPPKVTVAALAGCALVAGCGDSSTEPPDARTPVDASHDGTTMDAGPDRDGGDPDAARPDAPPPCDDPPAPPTLLGARIAPTPGADAYDVELRWEPPTDASFDRVSAEVASWYEGEPYATVMEPAPAAEGLGMAAVDKLRRDIFVRLVALDASGRCRTAGAPVRLAGPDYRDPDTWADGWIRVSSHNHTVPDEKLDAGEPIHANRINWFAGCYETIDDDAACHDLLLRSFSEQGLQWLLDAAEDKGIDSVVVTDHDNVGVWYTDTFRAHSRGDPGGPSVVPGLEWTSGLGHLTVIGNFLPEIDPAADITDPEVARRVHTTAPLPADQCDDTDENHDINRPEFDGPDAPCAREDHRGYGDDPMTVDETRTVLQDFRDRGALILVNHPTHDGEGFAPNMDWLLGNLDLVHGSEVNTPGPTVPNADAPEWWREQGLEQGRRWVGIAGTDCHVQGPPFVYEGDSGCNDLLGVFDITHMDAPYMWVKPPGSTSHLAPNAPELVVAALRHGRTTVVQDLDPAVVVDLGIDVNDDGYLDYWSGSTVPACESPERDEFEVQVRVRPVQTHNYNVNIWRAPARETRILDRTEIAADSVWTGTLTFRRGEDIPDGMPYGYVTAWVREDKRFDTDNDAGFSNPIWFEAPSGAVEPCNTRDSTGS